MSTFSWWGHTLEMFDHEYNTTALNERAVEIPIALHWLKDQVLQDGVEIGNVLSHYGFPSHQVIDLYEAGPGVTQSDVRDLHGSFDWIMAISTLEHVGEGEPGWTLLEPVKAIEHLRSQLTPAGAMLVTIPGGHNPLLDDWLAEGAGTSRACTLVRAGGDWVQTAEPQFYPYGHSTRWAESVWIGEWHGQREDRTEP